MNLKLLTILFLVFISFSLYSQEQKQKRPGRIGISYSLIGDDQERGNRMRYYDSMSSDEGEYRNIERLYSIGFNYIKPLSSWLEYEIGLEYSRKASTTKIVYPDTYSDLVFSKNRTNLLSVPLTLRGNFLKSFYINSGVFADFDLGGYNTSWHRYRPGIGLLFGAGAEVDIKHGFSFFMNPYYKSHSIIAFSSNDQGLKVDEAGIRVGLNFELKRTR